MKVNKEEILGLLVAVEKYLEMDLAEHRRELDERANLFRRSIQPVPGVNTEIVIQKIGNHFPQVRIWWDENDIRLTYQSLIEKLKYGHPSIETATKGWLGEGVCVCMSMARHGEERIVASRLKEILEKCVV